MYVYIYVVFLCRVDYTYIDINALAQAVKSFLASQVWFQTDSAAITIRPPGHRYACMYVSMYVCMFVCVCVYVCMYLNNVCIYVCMVLVNGLLYLEMGWEVISSTCKQWQVTWQVTDQDV